MDYRVLEDIGLDCPFELEYPDRGGGWIRWFWVDLLDCRFMYPWGTVEGLCQTTKLGHRLAWDCSGRLFNAEKRGGGEGGLLRKAVLQYITEEEKTL